MMPFHYPTAARLDSNGRSGYTARALAAEEGTAVPMRLITGVLALLATLLLPEFANAHAILEDSTPGIGASIKPGKLDLRFRYNSRIDRARSRLTLIHAGHSRDTVAIAPDGPPDVIAAHLDLIPGRYVLRWQVLAVDGHITRGDVPFTVTAL
jgi:copper resistance protein C